MNTETTQTTGGPADAPSRSPAAEPQPWHTDEDAKGWRTVYRGTGQRRQVHTGVLVDLTPEQKAWIDGAAEATGLTLVGFIHKLIDDARAAGPDATKQRR